MLCKSCFGLRKINLARSVWCHFWSNAQLVWRRLCENCIMKVLSFLYFYRYTFSHNIDSIAVWQWQACSCIANASSCDSGYLRTIVSCIVINKYRCKQCRLKQSLTKVTQNKNCASRSFQVFKLNLATQKSKSPWRLFFTWHRYANLRCVADHTYK